jgi:hypothetical protein
VSARKHYGTAPLAIFTKFELFDLYDTKSLNQMHSSSPYLVNFPNTFPLVANTRNNLAFQPLHERCTSWVFEVGKRVFELAFLIWLQMNLCIPHVDNPQTIFKHVIVEMTLV